MNLDFFILQLSLELALYLAWFLLQREIAGQVITIADMRALLKTFIRIFAVMIAAA